MWQGGQSALSPGPGAPFADAKRGALMSSPGFEEIAGEDA
jgi:hypothetical protein